MRTTFMFISITLLSSALGVLGVSKCLSAGDPVVRLVLDICGRYGLLTGEPLQECKPFCMSCCKENPGDVECASLVDTFFWQPCVSDCSESFTVVEQITAETYRNFSIVNRRYLYAPSFLPPRQMTRTVGRISVCLPYMPHILWSTLLFQVLHTLRITASARKNERE